MIAPAGSLRAPWEQFIGGVNRSGPQGLAQRSEQVKRLLREGGVTYNAVGAPQGPDRPWELDPLPMLFDQQSWQPLAEALVQRATLVEFGAGRRLWSAAIDSRRRFAAGSVVRSARLFAAVPRHSCRPTKHICVCTRPIWLDSPTGNGWC